MCCRTVKASSWITCWPVGYQQPLFSSVLWLLYQSHLFLTLVDHGRTQMVSIRAALLTAAQTSQDPRAWRPCMCVCVCVCVWERERERGRKERDREREREREKEGERDYTSFEGFYFSSDVEINSDKVSRIIKVWRRGWYVQFSCVWLFATPWTAVHQASLSITNSRSLLKLMCIASVMPSSHLIFFRPLLLLPSIFPSIRVFSSESVLCIRWPK